MDLNEAAKAVRTKEMVDELSAGYLSGISDEIRLRFINGEISMDEAAEAARVHRSKTIGPSGPPF